MSDFNPKDIHIPKGSDFDPNDMHMEQMVKTKSEPIPEAKLVEPVEISKLESLVRGAEQGITFGHGDELNALLESLISKKTYTQARDESRAAFDAAQETNPLTSLAGNLAGGLAVPIPGLGLGKAALNIGKAGTAAVRGGEAAATVAPTLRSALKIGAAGGALYGLGESREDLTKGDVGGALRDTIEGAGIGGALGGGLYGAGKLVGAGISKIANTEKAKKIISNFGFAREAGLAGEEYGTSEAIYAGKVKLRESAEEYLTKISTDMKANINAMYADNLNQATAEGKSVNFTDFKNKVLSKFDETQVKDDKWLIKRKEVENYINALGDVKKTTKVIPASEEAMADVAIDALQSQVGKVHITSDENLRKLAKEVAAANAKSAGIKVTSESEENIFNQLKARWVDKYTHAEAMTPDPVTGLPVFTLKSPDASGETKTLAKTLIGTEEDIAAKVMNTRAQASEAAAKVDDQLRALAKKQAMVEAKAAGTPVDPVAEDALFRELKTNYTSEYKPSYTIETDPTTGKKFAKAEYQTPSGETKFKAKELKDIPTTQEVETIGRPDLTPDVLNSAFKTAEKRLKPLIIDGGAQEDAELAAGYKLLKSEANPMQFASPDKHAIANDIYTQYTGIKSQLGPASATSTSEAGLIQEEHRIDKLMSMLKGRAEMEHSDKGLRLNRLEGDVGNLSKVQYETSDGVKRNVIDPNIEALAQKNRDLAKRQYLQESSRNTATLKSGFSPTGILSGGVSDTALTLQVSGGIGHMFGQAEAVLNSSGLAKVTKNIINANNAQIDVLYNHLVQKNSPFVKVIDHLKTQSENKRKTMLFGLMQQPAFRHDLDLNTESESKVGG
jgi:hypothetical protein